MGRIIFVTYGNQPYYNSLVRLHKEAERTRLFDEILIYTDKDLPTEITSNLLFSYKRGGGYWLWKPWVVLQALSRAKEDDIIVYSDCGNTVYPDIKGWHKFFKYLNNNNAVFFYNGGRMYKWARKTIFDYFPQIKKNNYQIISNFFLIKKSAEKVIYMWYDIMKNHPELVMDVDRINMEHENKGFIEHRHDQAVLSAIAYSMKKTCGIAIIPETTERLRASGQPVYNSRISDNNRRSSEVPSSKLILLLLDYIVKPIRRIETWFYSCI